MCDFWLINCDLLEIVGQMTLKCQKCRRRLVNRSFTIICANCSMHYHGKCLGLTSSRRMKEGDYLCGACNSKNDPTTMIQQHELSVPGNMDQSDSSLHLGFVDKRETTRNHLKSTIGKNRSRLKNSKSVLVKNPKRSYKRRKSEDKSYYRYVRRKYPVDQGESLTPEGSPRIDMSEFPELVRRSPRPRRSKISGTESKMDSKNDLNKPESLNDATHIDNSESTRDVCRSPSKDDETGESDDETTEVHISGPYVLERLEDSGNIWRVEESSNSPSWLLDESIVKNTKYVLDLDTSVYKDDLKLYIYELNFTSMPGKVFHFVNREIVDILTTFPGASEIE